MLWKEAIPLTKIPLVLTVTGSKASSDNLTYNDTDKPRRPQLMPIKNPRFIEL
jgi:hypothetical protein